MRIIAVFYFSLSTVLGLSCSSKSTGTGGGPNSPNGPEPNGVGNLLSGVLYVIPRNNEIIPNGDFRYEYRIDFLMSEAGQPNPADLSLNISSLGAGVCGGTPPQISNVSPQAISSSSSYYTASFVCIGNQNSPRVLVENGPKVQLCYKGNCVATPVADITDVKQSVGFEAISRKGFGYGLYVSLLMPDYEVQPVNASVFFSSKDPGLYTDLRPLWDWSEVDWEFVPMSSTLAGRNEMLYCPTPGSPGCQLYWTNMLPTQTTVPVIGPSEGYTLNGMIANPASGAPNQNIKSFDDLENQIIAKSTPYLQFDDSPHAVSINLALMEGIQNAGQYIFKGTGDWGKISDPNLATNYPDSYDLRTRYVTLNIIHAPYGKNGTTTSRVVDGIDTTQFGWTGTGIAKGFIGHGLIGTDTYAELKAHGPIRTQIGTNYSHPTGVVAPSPFNPYKKFYYYAVNYTATSMDFYIVDPADSRLGIDKLNNTNIAKFTPVRSFKIRDNSGDTISTIGSNKLLVDHNHYGLMKFGTDEGGSATQEGNKFKIVSYGEETGFGSLKWQIQTWLIAGLAGSEYATSNLVANSYLKEIAVYLDHPGGGGLPLQRLDFTAMDSNTWRYQFQREFAFTFGQGRLLGDGVGYADKGFWNLDLKANPVDPYMSLVFTQMPYSMYNQLSAQHDAKQEFVYKISGISGTKTLSTLDITDTAFASVAAWDLGELELFTAPSGTYPVSVYRLSSLTPGGISKEKNPSMTCQVQLGKDGSVSYLKTTSCETPPFSISRIQNVAAPTLNRAINVQPATVSCAGGNCTITTSWRNPSVQNPNASYFIYPLQGSSITSDSSYIPTLVQAGAIVASAKSSATITLPQKFVNASNSNIRIFSCIPGQSWPFDCPSQSNGYALESQLFADSKGGSSGGGGNGAPLAPTLVGPASISNCNPTTSTSPQTCDFTVTWTNPSGQQPPNTKYFIVPRADWIAACDEYADLIKNGAIVPSTQTSATLTLNKNYVGSTNPNVEIYACIEKATCPPLEVTAALCSKTGTPVSNLPGVSSTTGKDLPAGTDPISAVLSSDRKTITVSWNGSEFQKGSGINCYLQLTGSLINQAGYSKAGMVVDCSVGNILANVDDICPKPYCSGVLPPGSLRRSEPGRGGLLVSGNPAARTVSVGVCYKNTGLGVDSCPDNAGNYKPSGTTSYYLPNYPSPTGTFPIVSIPTVLGPSISY